jgi:hypothetical protein
MKRREASGGWFGKRAGFATMTDRQASRAVGWARLCVHEKWVLETLTLTLSLRGRGDE